jgi:CheY-like chemotaxis protein
MLDNHTLGSCVPTRKKNVLVAEDVDSNYQLLMALIGRHYNLRRAYTGLEALNIFQESDYRPDIILMDMKMPVMGGLEATREIRKVSPGIPIIALTANAFSDDREEAFAAGCNEFLTKPITADLLRKTIDKYC